jgi:hypothetical protein
MRRWPPVRVMEVSLYIYIYTYIYMCMCSSGNSKVKTWLVWCPCCSCGPPARPRLHWRQLAARRARLAAPRRAWLAAPRRAWLAAPAWQARRILYPTSHGCLKFMVSLWGTDIYGQRHKYDIYIYIYSCGIVCLHVWVVAFNWIVWSHPIYI